MKFIDLTAKIEDLLSGNNDVFSDMSEGDLIDLNRRSALAEMKLDIATALNLNATDSAILDEIATIYEDRMRVALAYLQLRYFYQENNNGEGSKGFYLMKEYARKYEKLRSGFGQLRGSDISSIRSAQVWL